MGKVKAGLIQMSLKGETSMTPNAIRDRMLVRELDRIAVKGDATPLAIFEPIAPMEDARPEQHALVRDYHAALAWFRAGRFATAAAAWTRLAAMDAPSARGLWQASAAHRLRVCRLPDSGVL